MSYQSLLTQSLTVYRPTVALDTSGGPVKTFNALANATSVRGLIQPLSTKEKLDYAQRQVYTSHRLWVALDYGVRRDDRVQLDNSPTVYYLVVDTFDRAGQQRVFEILLKEFST